MRSSVTRLRMPILSVRQLAVLLLVLLRVHHHNRVPRAAVKESAVRPLGGALLAPNASKGVYFDDAKGGGARVLNQHHALIHRAVGLADGGASAPGASFRDVGEYLWLLLSPTRGSLWFRGLLRHIESISFSLYPTTREVDF